MTPSRPIPAEQLDLAGLLLPGDHVVCGQVCAEPLALTRRLVTAGAHLPLQVFVGTLFSRTFHDPPPTMRFASYGAIGHASALADRGVLNVVSERYSRLAGLFTEGVLPADVVLLQLAIDEHGTVSAGLANDYVIDAARRARVVIAETHDAVPWTHGTRLPPDLRIDHWVQADGEPLELPAPAQDATATQIASYVAAIVPDGATLQVGVGSLPDATLLALRGHRHLGFHSGVLGNAGVALIQAGVVDNSRKGVDMGVSVANTLCGTREAYRFAHRNAAIEVRHTRFTHSAQALALLQRLHAVNGALEVDLSGQVNCETLGSRPRGGIGGLLDFARAARVSDGGRGITVLASTASGGRVSRIVPQLSGPATLGRADVDAVVTEHGVAHLRDMSLAERARRLIAVAAPQHRETLLAQLHTMTQGAA